MIIDQEDINSFKENISMKNFDIDYSVNTFETDSINISFLIIVKDCERSIKRCLNSILSQCSCKDEIIVVDTGSTDNTVEYLKDMAASYSFVKLYHHSWQHDFSLSRNKAINLASNNYCFFIDADEYLTEGSLENLRKYILILIKLNTDDFMIAPTIINTNDHILNDNARIFNKKIHHYVGKVHEYLESYNEKVLKIVSFENICLMHDGYEEGVVNINEKIHRNIKLLEKQLYEEPSPRWRYFYIRDGSYIWDNDTLINNAKEQLKIINNKHDYFYILILRQLIECLINNNNLTNAKYYLKIFNEINSNTSDVVYLNKLYKYHEHIVGLNSILNELIEFRNTRKNLDYGAFHSNHYHIDYLISEIMLSTGFLNEGLRIQMKLDNKGVYDLKENIKYFINSYKSFEEDYLNEV